MNAIGMAALGTLFTFFMTSMGAAMVFFFKKDISATVQRVFLGFAAGVMIAAAVWSLLIPAIEDVEAAGGIGWIPAAGGFLLGAAFLLLLDHVLPHLHPGSDKPEGIHTAWHKNALLFMAVTLHNIPEGMAVGIAFAMAAQHGDMDATFMATFAGAWTLALGIGIQNFPEGTALSLPLRQAGMSRGKAFLFGAASGIVEPIFGVLTVLIAGRMTAVMPWLLSFAAGAMIFVVAEELIPESQAEEHSHAGTFGIMAGFVVMMVLDVALG